MIMADVLKIFLIVVGILIVFISSWLMAQALFAQAVERARRRLLHQPVRSTLVGLVVSLPSVAVAVALLNTGPPGQLTALILIAIPFLVALMGSTALVRQIGHGLPSPVDRDAPWRPVLRGGIVLAFVFLMPFVGWFLILPWTLLAGLGAAVLGWRDRRSQPEEA